MCLIRTSYDGNEFNVIFEQENDGIRILKGFIAGPMVDPCVDPLNFQIPASEIELRLALICPFGWMLVNEETGQAWTADVSYPQNGAKVELPLPRKGSD